MRKQEIMGANPSTWGPSAQPKKMVKEEPVFEKAEKMGGDPSTWGPSAQPKTEKVVLTAAARNKRADFLESLIGKRKLTDEEVEAIKSAPKNKGRHYRSGYFYPRPPRVILRRRKPIKMNIIKDKPDDTNCTAATGAGCTACKAGFELAKW